jgi:hypothetical protein
MARVPKFGEREARAAEERGAEFARRPSALVAAALHEPARTIHLTFRSGAELSVPVSAISEIATAPIAALRNIAASPLGDGLIFDDANVAINVPGLLRDLFGEAIAGALGKRGGRARTAAKAAAARKNGQKGGRPRKTIAT